MLLVLKGDDFSQLLMGEITSGAVITVNSAEGILEGAIEAVYFKDDYIKELEDKAKGYNELLEISNKTIEAAEALLKTIK